MGWGDWGTAQWQSACLVYTGSLALRNETKSKHTGQEHACSPGTLCSGDWGWAQQWGCGSKETKQGSKNTFLFLRKLLAINVKNVQNQLIFKV